MREVLPDLFALAGFVMLGAGVGLEFGWSWSLMICGGVLMALGLASAWRRNR